MRIVPTNDMEMEEVSEYETDTDDDEEEDETVTPRTTRDLSVIIGEGGEPERR